MYKRAQNLWYHRKGLVIRNTFAKYEIPISYGKKVKQTKMYVELKFSANIGQMSPSRSRAQKLWYHRKCLVIRNTHEKPYHIHIWKPYLLVLG